MPKTQKSTAKIEYFATSVKRLVLLSFFTAGLYQMYWFYKNWQAVKNATGAKIDPIWRAIFSVFWAYPLFKHIAESTDERGRGNRYSAKALAVVYIVAAIGSNGLDLVIDSAYILFAVTVVLLAVSIWPVVVMQRQTNKHNDKHAADAHRGYAKTKGEMAVIVIGHLLFVFWIGSLFLSPASPALTPEQQSLSDKANELRTQYDDCATNLKLKEGSLNLDNQAAVDAHNAEVDKCEDVHMQQNEAADKYDASVRL
ncbi:MAG: transporter permease [Candidatus Saccharibacteria bacterium]|nr:transporter permease [Candidatus Saccharibacteria bacterium]